MAQLLNAAVFLLAQDEPGRGDDPGGAGGILIIVGIILLVLALGVFLARKFFVRGTMHTTPEEDLADTGEPAPADARRQRRRAQE